MARLLFEQNGTPPKDISRMKLLDVANEFARLDLFNHYSQTTVIDIASIFSKRAEIIEIEHITLTSLALFKERTLAIAKPVTYNGYLRYLRLIGDYALSHELISKNLFREVKLAPVETSIPPPSPTSSSW